MKIKNYQEDIVIHALNVMMEEQPDLKRDETFVNDVAAYVLNRMPPKFIMSERGFTRPAISQLIENGNGEGIESLVELMALINNGIKMVKERRKPGGHITLQFRTPFPAEDYGGGTARRLPSPPRQ